MRTTEYNRLTGDYWKMHIRALNNKTDSPTTELFDICRQTDRLQQKITQLEKANRNLKAELCGLKRS